VKAPEEFQSLLRSTLIALAICAGLVALGYFFVDRPVAFWVHDHGIAKCFVLKWITYAPPLLETWAPLVLVLVMIRRALGPVTKLEWTCFTAALALLVSDEFRESLAAVFGRDWPETWRDNNPSLIANDAYGFHWFRTGSDYGSFPSGHMARTVGAAAVLWVAFPQGAVRWCVVAISVAMAVSLLGMNYHFVSDVIAGSFLGAIVGAFAALLCGLTERRRAVPGSQEILNNE
jgi:membrane-associated phospholipid phosphatase